MYEAWVQVSNRVRLRFRIGRGLKVCNCIRFKKLTRILTLLSLGPESSGVLEATVFKGIGKGRLRIG